MVTAAQIEANRQNAKLSTGPRTEEGKQRSSLNATKHGLAADPRAFAERNREEFEARAEAWRESYSLRTEREAWLYENLVIETLRIDRCRMLEREMIGELADRAAASWEEDRRAEARTIAKRFAKEPALTKCTLETLKYGCELMYLEWENLVLALQENGDWTDSQKTTALDLLGVDHRFRAHHHLFKLGATDETGKLLDEREAFALAEIERLRIAADSRLEKLEDRRRENAERGLFVQMPKPLAAVLRYEKESLKRYMTLDAELRSKTKVEPSRTPVAAERKEAAPPKTEAVAAPERKPTPPASKPTKTTAPAPIRNLDASEAAPEVLPLETTKPLADDSPKPTASPIENRESLRAAG